MLRIFHHVLLAVSLALAAACSDSNDSPAAPSLPPVPTDFAAVDASLQAFIDAQTEYDGAALVIVDKYRGVIHEVAVGDFTTDTVVLLASTSKVPSSSLMMALAEDDNLDFDIDGIIDNYLPWLGVWTGRTVEQLVSNTSGIPGLGQISGYGAHLCQYMAAGQLLECGQTIYQTPLDNLESHPPGTHFEYGGSQWQLAGAVAEVVGGASWNQLFDQYIGTPCELEVFTYGNELATFAEWAFDPDSLRGRDNPNIEGGAISDLADYAKILSMHLNDGRCGEHQVLSPEGVAFMRIDRATPTGSLPPGATGYGMGWWVVPAADGGEPTLFYDPGAFGALSWLDSAREYGAFMAVQARALEDGSIATGYGRSELVPLVAAAYDAVRGQ